MSEKLSTSNHETTNDDSGDTTANDFPPFDPVKAQQLRDAAKAEKSSASPEDLKDVSKMLEQMEQMGANPEIVSNPAFRRMVERRIADYGLKMSSHAEANMSIGTFDIGAGNKQLAITSTGEKGDARHHDRSNINIIVRDDGTVVMECAYVDRDSRQMSGNTFRGYNGPTTSDGTVETTETKNTASITEFSIAQGGGLYSVERTSYESQYSPTYGEQGKFGLYQAGRDETVRVFGQNGDEQYREDKSYASGNLEGGDYVSPHLSGLGPDNKTPNQASFNLLRNPSMMKTDIEQITTYQRNPDGTMKVRDYNKGQLTEIERCPMNTQYGTRDLIPENGAIQAAREAAGQA